MKYHYVYRITNLKENKHYYGCRTCKIEPKLDLGVKYFSSSKDDNFLREQKEKPWQFKYKVINVFETRGEAILLEIKLHNKFNVAKNSNFYNRAKQTSTGWDTTGMHFDVSDEVRKKISISNKGRISPMKGKVHSEKTIYLMKKIKMGDKNPFYGKNHTDESKRQMSESIKGKTSGDKHYLRKNGMSDNHRESIRKATIGDKNPFYGKNHTDESKRQISLQNSNPWWVNEYNETIKCSPNDERLKTGNWKRGRKWYIN